MTGRKRPRNASKQAEAESGSPSSLQRLQRVLAAAGFGSRRECEELITEGRVEVDDEVVTELGSKVDPATQKILVDGEKVKVQRFEYFAVNKPPGVVSTNKDPSGRTRVIDLIRSEFRVYNVGRLDMSSEGLILVTNDGDLANHLTHPKYGIEKTYQVQTVGVPHPDQLEQLEKGVYLAEGKAKAKSVRILKKNRVGAILEIVLEEGRNREIRRLLARIGHKVTRLQRVAIGPVLLDGLPLGQYRDLTREEVEALKKWRPVGSKSKSKPRHSAGERKHSSDRKPKSPSDSRSKPSESKRHGEPKGRAKDSPRGKRGEQRSNARNSKSPRRK
ncbi:MAG: pseudouridine synthase [Pirellulaceae bacterium]